MCSTSVRQSSQYRSGQRTLISRKTTLSRYILSPIEQGRLKTSPQRRYLKQLFLPVILIWSSTTIEAVAQALIDEQQRLDFGTLAIPTNSTVSRLTYPRTDTNLSIEGQFVLIDKGSTGQYRFTGFPSNTTLDVSLSTATLNANGIGVTEPLSVDNYDFTQLRTNSLGEAELTLGARLNTSGNGSSYEDSSYSGTAVLRVDYWQPDVSAYVFNTEIISLETELSSTLNIYEEQQLDFGTLFARSSNTSQAEMTLSPSGSYSITEPENSRLVSLVKPEQGILRVSGAASNYSLTVTPQVADVFLEHTENPGSAPHFILSDLLASPDGTGKTDENGELLIRLGGTLKTELTASPTNYPSGLYEGTYELTVSY